MQDARLRARQYTRDHGEDIPEVTDWVWAGNDAAAAAARALDTTGGDNV
jgi:xylulose-5-phosphate/fructose-6-phosphate phosphoketolase